MSRLTLITLYRRGLALRLTCHTGLSLLFEVSVRPPHDGIRGWGGSICRAPLPQISGRIGGRYELTPPVVPVRTFLLPKQNAFISLTAPCRRRRRGTPAGVPLRPISRGWRRACTGPSRQNVPESVPRRLNLLLLRAAANVPQLSWSR